MRMYDLITKKKQGEALTKEEINFIVEGFTNGTIPDYQMSAFLMAVCLKEMNLQETIDLTMAMVNSGEVLDLSPIVGKKADKHSTGGVGDKTSLIIGPMVAALGVPVAKMSGRGLGHTGGTIDKLESFPGFSVSLTEQQFFDNVNRMKLAIIGHTANLAPADKKMYALRDVTATVNNLSLISSSIMSKKIAAGSDVIVLDVKCGSGAFMKTKEDAKKLAEGMVTIGKMCGRNTKALITNMDVPLGFAVGNSLEVIEAIDVLKGKTKGDIGEVSVSLASGLVASLENISTDEAKVLCEKAIDDGTAFMKFKEWISSQGGDASFADNTDLFPEAKFEYQIKSTHEGYISHMDAEKIGLCSCELGAGRKTKTDIIDLSSGLVLSKKTGYEVKHGDVIATLYTNREETIKQAESIFLSALEFSHEKPDEKTLIIDRIE